jgi:hypothetical protein
LLHEMMQFAFFRDRLAAGPLSSEARALGGRPSPDAFDIKGVARGTICRVLPARTARVEEGGIV